MRASSLGLLVVTIVSLSQASVIARWTAAPAEVVGFWRMALAGLALTYFAWRRRGELNGPGGRMAVLSGSFFFLHLYTYIFAAQNTQIGNAVLLFAVNPLITSAIVHVRQRRIPGPFFVVAYAFAAAGLFVLLHQKLEFGEHLSDGDWAALASAFFFCGYVLTGNESRKTLPTTLYTWLAFITAGMLFLISCVIKEREMLGYTPSTWLAIACYVIVPTFLGHSLFAYLMTSLPLPLMSWGKLVEPLFAGFSAFVFFGEAIGIEWFFAFALTAVGAAVLQRVEPTRVGPREVLQRRGTP
jgi:drug/metabolite transporter (DMT)-like permease